MDTTILQSPLKVLFLCTGNSCRSQMAEGWTRHLRSEQIEAYSAGTNPQGLNRLAVLVMSEVGVDISHHRSEHVDGLAHLELDLVITVCDRAQGACAAFSGRAGTLHREFDDPPRLARNAASQEEALVHYRRIRDEIRAFVETLPGSLTKGGVGISRG